MPLLLARARSCRFLVGCALAAVVCALGTVRGVWGDAGGGSGGVSGEGYDPAVQMVAALREVLRAVPVGGSLFWSVEEECAAGPWGWFVPVPLVVDAVPAVTLTCGRGEVSVEVDVPVPVGSADARLLCAPGAAVSTARVLGLGLGVVEVLWGSLVSSSSWQEWVDDAADQVLLPAVSEDFLAAQLSAVVAVLRPDVSVVPDRVWRSHDRPLAQLLAYLPAVESGVAEPGWPVDDGPELFVSARSGFSSVEELASPVLDVVLGLEVEAARHWLSLSPAERARRRYVEAWMAWTDGTFDPQGWAFPS